MVVDDGRLFTRHHGDGFHALDRLRPADAGIPNALFVWIGVSAAVAAILQRTVLGRFIYALGNKEAAAYLAGVNTKGVTVVCFALCGLTSGLSGVLLAGYSQKAYQGMGDPYLLPAIAAVVIGGTNILGGRGRYLGTFVGVILIVLLNSVLSIMEMPEAGRQVIYGGVIILMLLGLRTRRGGDELRRGPRYFTLSPLSRAVFQSSKMSKCDAGSPKAQGVTRSGLPLARRASEGSCRPESRAATASIQGCREATSPFRYTMPAARGAGRRHCVVPG